MCEDRVIDLQKAASRHKPSFHWAILDLKKPAISLEHGTYRSPDSPSTSYVPGLDELAERWT